MEEDISLYAICIATKVKQLSIIKVSDYKITSKARERMFMDMVFIKKPLKLNANVAIYNW